MIRKNIKRLIKYLIEDTEHQRRQPTPRTSSDGVVTGAVPYDLTHDPARLVHTDPMQKLYKRYKEGRETYEDLQDRPIGTPADVVWMFENDITSIEEWEKVKQGKKPITEYPGPPEEYDTSPIDLTPRWENVGSVSPRHEDGPEATGQSVDDQQDDSGSETGPTDDSPDIGPSEGGSVKSKRDRDFNVPIDVTVTESETVPYFSGGFLKLEHKVETEEHGPLMGRDAYQAFLKDHETHENKGLWYGLAQEGIERKEVGIPKEAWNRHGIIYGQTGAGKSTFEGNVAESFIEQGHGGLVIDPDGGLIDDILQRIPEHRKDDIIYISPSDRRFDKSVAINFLDVSKAETEAEKQVMIETRVSDLVGILKDEDMWGARMDGVFDTLARAMMESRRQFTLTDMFTVLNEEERMHKFVEALEDEGLEAVSKFAQSIEDLDYELIEPLTRRLKDWVENPIYRRIAGHRESSIDLTEAVEQEKIILLSPRVESREIKRVLTTTVLRRVWTAVRKRNRTQAQSEYNHFITLIDELHEVVSENLQMDDILALGRSGKMGLFAASQNPAQIPENIRQQLYSNTTFQAFFTNGSRKINEEIAEELGGNITPEAVFELPDFKLFTRTIDPGTEDDGLVLNKPTTVSIFPPTPPRRTRREAQEMVAQRLEQIGIDNEDKSLEETERLLDSLGNEDIHRANLLEAIWETEIKQGQAGVKLSEVADAFNNRSSRDFETFSGGIYLPAPCVTTEAPEFSDDPALITAESENVPSGQLVQLEDPELTVATTEEGRQYLLNRDSTLDRQQSLHIQGLREVFVTLALTGYTPIVAAQGPQLAAPDGKGIVPVSFDGDSPGKLRELTDQYTDEHPEVEELSNARPLRLESETTTYKKPSMVLEKAVEANGDGEEAVFITPHLSDLSVHDKKSEDYAPRIVDGVFSDPPYIKKKTTTPPGVTEDNPLNAEADILYNKREDLPLHEQDQDDKIFGLIPRGADKNPTAVWVDKPGVGKLILYDQDNAKGTEWARIRPEEASRSDKNGFDVWCRKDNYDDEWEVFKPGGKETYDTKREMEQDYMVVPKPIYPPEEFDMSKDPTDQPYEIFHRAPTVVGPTAAELVDSSDSDAAHAGTTQTEAHGETVMAQIIDSEQVSEAPLEDYTTPTTLPITEIGEKVGILASKLPIRFFGKGEYALVIPTEKWAEYGVIDDISNNQAVSSQHAQALAEARDDVDSAEELTAEDPHTVPVTKAPEWVSSSPGESAFGQSEQQSEEETSGDENEEQTAAFEEYPTAGLTQITPEEPLDPDSKLITEGGPTVDATKITSVDPTEYLFWEEVRRTAEGQADTVTDETGKLLSGFPLREHDLAGLIRTAAATNLTEAQALDAIAKGIDAGYIMEVTGRHFLDTDAEESGSLPDGITTGTTLYGIISPRQAPGRILDDPTDFGVAYWRKAWDDRDFDAIERKPKNILKVGSYDDPVTAKERQEAILGAGEHLDALERMVEGDSVYYRLKYDSYPTPLNDIWGRSNKEINNPLPKEYIVNLAFQYYVEVESEDFGITDARTKVQDWITAGKLIDASDEAGANDHYRMVEPDELREEDVSMNQSPVTGNGSDNQTSTDTTSEDNSIEEPSESVASQQEPDEMPADSPSQKKNPDREGGDRDPMLDHVVDGVEELTIQQAMRVFAEEFIEEAPSERVQEKKNDCGDYQVEKSRLRTLWDVWSSLHDFEEEVHSTAFMRDSYFKGILSLDPKSGRAKRNEISGESRPRIYIGIRLSEQGRNLDADVDKTDPPQLFDHPDD